MRTSRRRRAKEQVAAEIAKIERCITQAHTGDVSAVIALKRANIESHQFIARHCPHLETSIRDAIYHGERVLRHQQNTAGLNKAREDWAAATNHEETITALLNYLYFLTQYAVYDQPVDTADRDNAFQALNASLQARRDELLKQAKAGDVEALITVNTLITSTWWHGKWAERNADNPYSHIWGESLVQLTRPDDWDKLVAWLMPNPTLLDFAEREVALGDVLAWAVQASNKKDPVLARYILTRWHSNCADTRRLPSQLIIELQTIVTEWRNATVPA